MYNFSSLRKAMANVRAKYICSTREIFGEQICTHTMEQYSIHELKKDGNVNHVVSHDDSATICMPSHQYNGNDEEDDSAGYHIAIEEDNNSTGYDFAL